MHRKWKNNIKTDCKYGIRMWTRSNWLKTVAWPHINYLVRMLLILLLLLLLLLPLLLLLLLLIIIIIQFFIYLRADSTAIGLLQSQHGHNNNVIIITTLCSSLFTTYICSIRLHILRISRICCISLSQPLVEPSLFLPLNY
jgi:hypothetical protein